MRNKYMLVAPSTRFWHKMALAGLLAAGTTAAQAQFYLAPNVTNAAGTYSDLGTTGTAIATANTDDANSAATPIGFTFTYNGTAFTDFVLNTNGFLKLGTTAPTGPAFTDGPQSLLNGPITSADANLLLPFNQDLFAGTAGGTEYRVATTGTAPNRVTTIQWKNVSDKTRGTFGVQFANISFQVKLYETSNQIEFVYGPGTAGPAAGDAAKFVTVGIKGTNAAQSVLGVKASATPWSGTTFISGNYTGNAHNIRTTALPDAGRTYSFTLPVANDAAVQLIYAYGKLVVPAGQPTTLQALVRNAGTAAISNVSVTLAVTGANTVTAPAQTIASLAPGATSVVSFPGVALPNAGSNTLTVTVPTDGNNGNNTQTLVMTTDPTTSSYIYPGVPAASSYGFTPTATAFTAAFGAKFTLNTARLGTGVNAFIGSDANLVGKTVFGVMADFNTGAILGRSPDYVLTAADLNTLKSFTLSSNVSLPAGDFLVGLAQVVPANSTQAFPMAYQAENPAREEAFYQFSVSTPGTPADNTANNARYMLEAVTAALPANDAAVQIIYSLGKSPVNTAQAVQAVVRNSGSTALTNVAVALNVTGANTYATAQVVPSLAVGASATVSFPAFTPTAVGNNTLTVTIPADAVASNNTQTYTQAVTPSTFSYANTATPTSSVGFQPTITGAFIAKFTTPNARTIGGVGAVLADLDATGRTVYAVMVNATGGLVARSADYVIQAADINQLKSFTFSTPVAVAAGNFYVGLVQTTDPTGNGYFPMGTIAESPTRTGTFYTAVPFTALGGTLVDAASSNLGIFMLEAQNAIVQGTSAALNRAVSMYPNPSTGVVKLDVRGANAKGNLHVQVINLLGQTVYSAKLQDNFTNEVNLSGLAGGIYTLKVQTGSEFTSRQLVLTK
ncbi:T9SS type A sorting domain-containing protein [Hymenobacter sp. BT186]|uniref:T9SS type A sorting domain-containing protein n=1 Tax=Hymenobacter telluris TaxID=2816474 RepID=A0A939J8H5_9BACT|nr:CARDB domain-containing protein [Hymenobacter telluris]MBO0357759.1 T9SS type A sorting domain-containing protein [Hymenobacter telluris]MBW3373786.1 T9SS type A sorting domain-containing protein [Hymenobacter norwichensis]